MVVLFPEDQVSLKWGKLRRQEDVGAEGREEFIEGRGAGRMESREGACLLGGRSWLVYVEFMVVWRDVTDLFVGLSWW